MTFELLFKNKIDRQPDAFLTIKRFDARQYSQYTTPNRSIHSWESEVEEIKKNQMEKHNVLIACLTNSSFLTNYCSRFLFQTKVNELAICPSTQKERKWNRYRACEQANNRTRANDNNITYKQCTNKKKLRLWMKMATQLPKCFKQYNYINTS